MPPNCSLRRKLGRKAVNVNVQGENKREGKRENEIEGEGKGNGREMGSQKREGPAALPSIYMVCLTRSWKASPR